MRRLLELLCIKPSPTTAFHPQMDGQTERVNQVLEQYLRMFTSRCQDDWADLLPLTEFAYNNASHLATGFFPFYATYGYYPTLSFVTPTSSTVLATKVRVQHLQQVHEELKIVIQMAREQIKINYDKKTKMPPTFHIGDKVFLRHDNISTNVP